MLLTISTVVVRWCISLTLQYVLVILFLVIAEIAAGIVGFVFRDTIVSLMLVIPS